MLKLGVYQHYKNQKEYNVLCIALEEANPNSELVIYQALYDDQKIWARPIESFREILDINGKPTPRFQFLRDN